MGTELESSTQNLGKSFGIGFEKIWYRKKYRYWYRKNFGIEKSIGIGIGKELVSKKYRYRFRKFLVSKKVSVLVSKNFGIGIGFEKMLLKRI